VAQKPRNLRCGGNARGGPSGGRAGRSVGVVKPSLTDIVSTDDDIWGGRCRGEEYKCIYVVSTIVLEENFVPSVIVS
jgi:hypothetical protein